MNKYKTFEELKEELGDKFEEYMYGSNINLLNNWNKLKEWLEEGIQNPFSTWGEVYPKDTYENVLEYMQEIEKGGMNE